MRVSFEVYGEDRAALVAEAIHELIKFADFTLPPNSRYVDESIYASPVIGKFDNYGRNVRGWVGTVDITI